MNICLSTIGIAIIIFYSFCDTSCSYLQGDIFGVDLKYIGIGYMMSIIAFSLFKQMEFIRILLAVGIGVEIYLIAFQFIEDVFCPYCMAFAMTIILTFIINFERLQPENSWQSKIIYGFCSVEFSMMRGRIIPLLIFAISGFVFVALTFSGSAIPVYDIEKSLVP